MPTVAEKSYLPAFRVESNDPHRRLHGVAGDAVAMADLAVIVIPFSQREVRIVGEESFVAPADDGVAATVDADGGTETTGRDATGAD